MMMMMMSPPPSSTLRYEKTFDQSRICVRCSRMCKHTKQRSSACWEDWVGARFWNNVLQPNCSEIKDPTLVLELSLWCTLCRGITLKAPSDFMYRLTGEVLFKRAKCCFMFLS